MMGQNEAMEFKNVREDFVLYDTVAVYPLLSQLSIVPPGWFASFAALSNANNLSFFDIRNRANCDLAYCNQDTRDQTAFAMEIEAIGVSFWGPGVASVVNPGQPFAIWTANKLPFWEGDLPQHCSLKLRVQQDEKLKLNALMAPAGVGPTGGGFGNMGGVGSMTGTALSAASQGVAHLTNQWMFPEPLRIPRRASIGVQIELAEYARQVVRTWSDLGEYQWVISVDPGITQSARLMWGITVAMSGKRLVQQRGELHA